VVLKILDIIRQYRDGRPTSESPWDTYKLRREEYSDLIRLVKKEESLSGYFEDKFRYEYNA
jgi:hypothetical protein